MLTTHIKARKYFWGFLSFANFYFLLVMQIFMDFIVTPKIEQRVKYAFYMGTCKIDR